MQYIDIQILQQRLIKLKRSHVAFEWTTVFNHIYYKKICTENAKKNWLILPVVICSSTRLTNLGSRCSVSCKKPSKTSWLVFPCQAQ